jgi:ATP-dependent RNA helicase DeaD
MRSDVDALCEALNLKGHPAESLHGGLTQESRDRVMRRFRSGAVELLIATNVAARGIDVPHLSHVINFELPESPDDYVHRIGRTARAGRAGVALTLVEPRELRALHRFESMLRVKVEIGAVPSVADLRARELERTHGALREALGRTDLDRFRPLLEALSSEFAGPEVALAAIQLAHAASGADKEQPEIPSPRIEPRHRNVLPHARGKQDGFARGRGPARPPRGGRDQAALHVGLGRAQGVRPGDLVGAIVNETGLHPREIGSIAIGDHHSTVELPRDRVEHVAHVLREATIRGRRVPVEIGRSPVHVVRSYDGNRNGDRAPVRAPERRRNKRG